MAGLPGVLGGGAGRDLHVLAGGVVAGGDGVDRASARACES